MNRCHCIKSDGKQCTREASSAPGKNTLFCWQHQNCKNDLFAKKKYGKKMGGLSDQLWPQFYPKIDNIPYDGPIDTMIQQYTYLLQKLPMIVDNPKQAKIFAVIDLINQLHQETIKYIQLKAGPYLNGPHGTLAYNENIYCPLDDTSLQKYELGKGIHGIAYSVTGPDSLCCNEPIKFVFKSTTDQVKTQQLTDIYLNARFEKHIISQKKTNIVAAEVAALAFSNYLVNKSINYNVPYFYGAEMCSIDDTLYMYMQEIPTQFTSIEQELKQTDSKTRHAMLLQGLMTLIAFYKIKLIHGDLKGRNFAFRLIPQAKRPLYKYNDTYYIGPMTNKVLYFIDFGIAFIKKRIEASVRIAKDKGRINNDINWQDTIAREIKLGHPRSSYKGQYIPDPSLENATYIRRHLLDLYHIFDSFTSIFGREQMKDVQPIMDYFMPIFYNPVYYANHLWKINEFITHVDQAINFIWANVLNMVINLTNIQVIDQTDLISLNPNDLMFLGNLDAGDC